MGASRARNVGAAQAAAEAAAAEREAAFAASADAARLAAIEADRSARAAARQKQEEANAALDKQVADVRYSRMMKDEALILEGEQMVRGGRAAAIAQLQMPAHNRVCVCVLQQESIRARAAAEKRAAEARAEQAKARREALDEVNTKALAIRAARVEADRAKDLEMVAYMKEQDAKEKCVRARAAAVGPPCDAAAAAAHVAGDVTVTVVSEGPSTHGVVRGLCGWLAGCCCSARMRAEREEHERKEKECARLRAAQEKVMDRRVRVALPGMHSSVIAPCFTTCHRRVFRVKRWHGGLLVDAFGRPSDCLESGAPRRVALTVALYRGSPRRTLRAQRSTWRRRSWRHARRGARRMRCARSRWRTSRPPPRCRCVRCPRALLRRCCFLRRAASGAGWR